MVRPIHIVDYNSEWVTLYYDERTKIKEIFGDLALSIHHVGSTAIKTSKAKPEIDIMIVIKDKSNIHECNANMTNLGYRVRGECLDQGGTPGRFYYDKKHNDIKTHKAHILQVGHYDIFNKLLFVKYLNDMPELGKQYAQIKEDLAKKFDYGDIAKYLTEKGIFIKKCVRDAKAKYSTLTYDDFIS